MPAKTWIEIASFVLPTSAAVLIGWIFLRRLEEVKAEVVRYSDFNRKWADLFFNASNAYMESIERVLTNYQFLSGSHDPNDEWETALVRETKELLPKVWENYNRILRLVVFAPSTRKATEQAAEELFEVVRSLTKTRRGVVADIRRSIESFNYAARAAHA